MDRPWRAVVDFGGRPYAVIEADFRDAPFEIPALVAHVFESIAFQARMNLHAAALRHTQSGPLSAGRCRAVALDPRRGGVPVRKTLTG